MAIDNPVLPSYILNVPDPTEGIRQSLQLALGVGQARQQAQAAQDAHAAAQQAQQLGGIQIQGAQQTVDANALAQRRTLALRDAWAKESQNPTPQGMTRILTQFPEAAEMVQKAGGALDEQQVKQLTPIYAPMVTGHPDIVKSEIEKAALAWDDPKSGNPQKAKQLRDLSALYDKDPGGAAMKTAAALATSMGVPKFDATFRSLMGVQTEQQKAEADLLTAQHAAAAGAPAAADAQRAYDLKQRVDGIAADQAAQTLKTLPDKVQESVAASTKEAYDARNLSGKLRNLIAKGEFLINSGKASHGFDIIKGLYGGQDASDNLRNQIEGFKGSSVLGAMASAGGKGSEGIIGLGQEGQPGKYDDMKSAVLPYLRRLADAAEKAVPLALDMARWQTISRGIQPAPKDFVLPSGRKVKEGDFYDSLAKGALPVTPDAQEGAPPSGSPPAKTPAVWTPAHDRLLAELARRRNLHAGKASSSDPRGELIGSWKF